MNGILNRYISYGLKAIICAVVLACLCQAAAFAQSENLNGINEPAISKEIERIEGLGDLSEDDKKQIKDILSRAKTLIAEADTNKGLFDKIKSEREAAPPQITALEDETAELRKRLESQAAPLPKAYDELPLSELPLSELEGRLREANLALEGMQTQKANDEDALRLLDQRPSAATSELAEVNKLITDLSPQAATSLDVQSAPLDYARAILLRARLKAAQARKQVLEQEIPSLPNRRELLSARINKLHIEILLQMRTVTALRIRTGAARTEIASLMYEATVSDTAAQAARHTFVQTYAKGNEALAAYLVKIVSLEDELPAIEAQTRAMISQVSDDQSLADSILEPGKLSRSYGNHLRKLREKQPEISSIRAGIRERDGQLEDALFERIVNQEQLQQFNATAFDIDTEFLVYQVSADNDAPLDLTTSLTEEDRQALRSLNDYRRELVNRVKSFSDYRAAKLVEVVRLERELLNNVVELCELLDARLLWLPSTEPISLSWPGKVIQGFGHFASQTKPKALLNQSVAGLKSSALPLTLMLIALLATVVIRRRFAPFIENMPSQVGRVQKDSYALTPIAVGDGFLSALPYASIPLFIGMILSSQYGMVHLDGPFMELGIVISIIVFVFMSLYAWSAKRSLFQVHFRVDSELRNRLRRYLPGLIILQIISLLLIGLTRDNPDADTAIGAVSVLGFLIGSVSIAYFAIRIAWSRSKVHENRSLDEGIYVRNEKWFFMIAIGLPILTICLAIVGYLETARLLLFRFFLSFCVLIAAYVIHGLLRRSLVIAKRRLALEQARAKRDAEVKARLEKVAAEERGEIVEPKVDYEQIDLESINRQTGQLINISVIILVFGFLWALWGNLLPALSVIDDINLGGLKNSDGGAITAWNLMQAFGIGVMAWLAARNIPGFLDIFVLKRFNMQQSSRFAIVTVLRYIIVVVGIVWSFDKLGMQWSQLQWIVAALGVGIGFGLQAIFANLISGLIILFERPIRIGDYITIGDISGTVSRIQIRATTLLDLENKEILIPNQEIVSSRVTNWTLTNSTTRMTIKVGIAYGSDTALAHEIMLGVCKDNKSVLVNPEPNVLFMGFGDSTLDFHVRVFLRDFFQRPAITHELHMALDQALRKAGIEVAFPQRDLHIRNPEAIKEALAPILPKPGAKPKPKKS